MKCERPLRSGASSREPLSTQIPIATDARPGTSSDRTRTPFASSLRRTAPGAGAAASGAAALVCPGWCRRTGRRSAGSARLRAEGLLARQPDLPALVDLEDLHEHLVAFVQDVAHA